jgi:hypothetical protein
MERGMSNTRKAKGPAPAVTKVTAAEPPVLLGKGRYAIFQSPDGEGVVTYRPDGQDHDSHHVVPARFWNLILGAIKGDLPKMDPVSLMRMMSGR